MQLTKLRMANGLVPAGRYFAHLAQGLVEANAREAARREQLAAEDRKLEARYRRAPAARNVSSSAEMQPSI